MKTMIPAAKSYFASFSWTRFMSAGYFGVPNWNRMQRK